MQVRRRGRRVERMSALDASGRGVRVLLGAYPVAVPSIEALRRAVATIARADPGRRLVTRIDAKGRWVIPADHEIDALAAEAVVELTEAGDVDARMRATAALYDPAIPVRVAVGHDFLAVLIDHARSDGWVNSRLLPSLATVALGGEVPAFWSTTDSPAPLRAALRATFGSAASVLGVLRLRRATRALAATAVDEAVGATPLEGAPDLGIASTVLDPDTFAAVRAWGKARGAGIAAVEAVLYRRALARVGIAAADHVEIAVDLRRYLPAGAVASGNFVAGWRVRGAATVAEVKAQLDAALAAGAPLAVATLGAAVGELRRRLTAGRSAARVSGAATAGPASVVVSSVGILRGYDALPWVGPVHERRAPAAGDVPGPEGVTMLSLATGRALHVSASFDTRVHARERIEEALRWVREDPFALLGDA